MAEKSFLFPEVERIGENDSCRLFTSLTTPTGGRDSARGTMFTIRPSRTMDILGLEFDFIPSAATDLTVQVYARKGNFTDVMSDESAWSLISDTVAIPSPDNRGAIIPAKDIRPIQAEKGEFYSFYLYVASQGVLNIGWTSQTTEVGSPWQADDQLEMSIGMGMSTGPFPGPGEQMAPAQFRGRFHYSVVKPCNETLTTTDVELEFAGKKEQILVIGT
jgi:hypothetical protein